MNEPILHYAQLSKEDRARAEAVWLDINSHQPLPEDHTFRQQALWVFAHSQFVAQNCQRYPELLSDLYRSGDLYRRAKSTEWTQHLENLSACVDKASWHQGLRQIRQRELVRNAWRDLCDLDDVHCLMRELSDLADAMLAHSVDYLFNSLTKTLGLPMGKESGLPQSLIVLAMGKLGGRELNFSSDIDLIFAYPESGETQGGPRAVANETFFIRLGQQLIEALDSQTADGFVFRVDMRLRPFGKSGALAGSFAALEGYYQSHGREWERYALIKARAVTGNPQDAARLLQTLSPFVYRRYIDFGVFSGLREMKELIAQQAPEDHLKLGHGGIREIEFIVQSQQLVRGGRLSSLCTVSLMTALNVLQEIRALPEEDVIRLREGYAFLRRLEHRLQIWNDEQTHRFPADPLVRQRLAVSMGFSQSEALISALNGHQTAVKNCFQRLFVPTVEPSESSVYLLLWMNPEEADSVSWTAQMRQTLHTFRHSRRVGGLSVHARERLDHLMPLLLEKLTTETRHSETCLLRLLSVIEAIIRRSAYLALLIENPGALQQLVFFCDVSDWFSAHIARYPVVLDQLLDPQALYAPMSPESLAVEWKSQKTVCDDEDMEGQMDALRQFRQAQVLRIAAADVSGYLDTTAVSQALSWLAEVILQQVLRQSWQALVQKYGAFSEAEEIPFAVIAYGKLGSGELSYQSDLDLVFLYPQSFAKKVTQGDKSLGGTVFFSRLGQRIIHMLSTTTAAGILYEVDMRLRPDGASGLLVSSIESFADYQRNKAWLWEYQALVKARMVVGSKELGEQFEKTRTEVLSQSHDESTLRQEVTHMREKMREHLDSSNDSLINIKHVRGGLVDIEFMVQYGVLRLSETEPDVLIDRGNLLLLQSLLRAKFITELQENTLSEAFLAYRKHLHHAAIYGNPAQVERDKFRAGCDAVETIWNQLLLVNP